MRPRSSTADDTSIVPARGQSEADLDRTVGVGADPVQRRRGPRLIEREPEVDGGAAQALDVALEPGIGSPGSRRIVSSSSNGGRAAVRTFAFATVSSYSPRRATNPT